MRFLNDITSNAAVNKMSPLNLGICIGPNLLCHPPGSTPDDILKNTGLINKATAIMIEHFDVVFKDIAVSDSLIFGEADYQLYERGPANDMHLQAAIAKCEVRNKGKAIPLLPLSMVWSTYRPPDRPAPVRAKSRR
jgi:hypothetical protein